MLSLTRSGKRKADESASDEISVLPHRAARGVIKKLHLRDFLCHENLEIQLNPGVNIITGKTGSGKSAVVAAISFALGGKTAPGRTLQEYIRTGATSCQVSITLSNLKSDRGGDEIGFGHDGMGIDFHGDEFTIERTVNRDDEATCCVKNGDGKVISREPDDIVRIMDKFNIQPDNPSILLDEYASREIFQSYSPSNLYKFFIGATKFDQMRREKVGRVDSLAETEVAISEKTTSFEQQHKEVKRLQSLLDKQCELDMIRNHLALLNVQFAWLQVAELEEELTKLCTEIATIDDQLNTNCQQQAIAKDSLAAANESKAALDVQIEQLRNSTNERMEGHSLSKRNVDQLRTTVGLHNTNVATFQTTVDCLRSRMLQLRPQLDLQIQRQAELATAKRRMQKNLTEGSQRKQVTKALILRLSNALADVEEEIVKFSCEETKATANCRSYETRLRQLRAGGGDPLLKFGHFMPSLREKIDEAVRRNEFKKPPIGPFGAHISVREKKWALAAELALKSCLSSFLCDNMDDRNVLEKLIDSIVPQNSQTLRPSIIVSGFKSEFSSNMPQIQCEHTSLLSVLEFNDPNVHNAIVDHFHMGSVILTEMSGVELNQYMRTPVARNFKAAYSINGDQCSPGRYYAHRGDTRARILAGSVEDIISDAEARLTEATAVLQRSLAQLDKANRRRVDLTNQRRAEEQTLQTLSEELLKLSGEIQELAADIRIEQQPTLIAEMFKNVAGRLGNTEDQLRAEQVKLSDAKQRLEDAEVEFRRFDEVVREAAEKRAALEVLTARAREKCARPETFSKCTAKAALEAAKALEQELDQAEERIGSSEEEVRVMLATARAERKVKFAELQRAFEANEETSTEIGEHKPGYPQLQQLAGVQMKLAFADNFAKRGYEGKLRIMHDDQKIYISISPCSDDTSSPSEASSSKKQRLSIEPQEQHSFGPLSPSERSFAMVCFVLALWEIVDSPVRCMDGFDVSMDLVTQRKVFEMLLKFARTERASDQFIFISAVDPSFIPRDELIGIFRLPDP